jgi:hypothetical protein
MLTGNAENPHLYIEFSLHPEKLDVPTHDVMKQLRSRFSFFLSALHHFYFQTNIVIICRSKNNLLELN